MTMEKKKRAIRECPNPLAHMFFWGFWGGWFLAALFNILVFLEQAIQSYGFVSNFPEYLGAFSILAIVSFFVGALPGVCLGIFEGLLLAKLTVELPLPFKKIDMQAVQTKIYISIALTTVLAGFLLIGSVAGFNTLLESFRQVPALLVFPPFIAGIAAAYAAHRYMFRLRLWSEQQYGVQKEKAKNFEHLEDKAEIEEMGSDDGKEEKIQKLS